MENEKHGRTYLEETVWKIGKSATNLKDFFYIMRIIDKN